MEATRIYEIEEAMRKYYEDKKLLDLLRIKLKNLNNDIKDLQEKLELSKIEFDTNISAQTYDSIGSGSNENHGIEVEIERAYFRLEKLIERKKIQVIETENQIYDIKSKVDFITESIEGQIGLNTTLKEILDLRYNRKYSMKYIINKFYSGANATAYRDRDKVLESVEAIIRLNGLDIF